MNVNANSSTTSFADIVVGREFIDDRGELYVMLMSNLEWALVDLRTGYFVPRDLHDN